MIDHQGDHVFNARRSVFDDLGQAVTRPRLAALKADYLDQVPQAFDAAINQPWEPHGF